MQNHSKLKLTIISSILLISLNNCSPNQQKQFNQWTSHTESLSQASTTELAKIAFHHSYKESKWDNIDQSLYVEYGGSSALTFSDSKNYKPMTLLDLATKSYRLFYYGNPKGLKTLRVSLVKPFYVKNAPNPETEIQEFEVLRIRIDTKIWESIRGNDTLELYEIDDEDQLPSGKFREELNLLMDSWKIELDEFSRIEVK
ncbi:MAG: hypothetical protein JJT78_14790 [Leptospira sp.]|nr:hypothetical protein [Leptospira sp.]